MLQPIAIFSYSFYPNNLQHFLYDHVHPFERVASGDFFGLCLQLNCSNIFTDLIFTKDIHHFAFPTNIWFNCPP